MIDVQNLVKWYGPTLAVDHLTFAIPKGQVVGFLGPNGAGKTTTLRILTGYMPPTSGVAKIAGHDALTQPKQVRAKIGYLPENNPLYPEMRVEEYLHYRGKLQKMARANRAKRIDEVCARCGLTAARRRVIGQLSKGNRQRVGLAQAMLHDPPLLILDEPTAGLDPNQVTQFRQLISELRDKHTILLSTHILSEVERAADHVLIIAAGKIVAQGSPRDLRRGVSSGSRVVVEVKAPADQAAKLLGGLDHVAKVDASSHNGWCRAVVEPKEGRDVREAIGQALVDRSWPVREMRQEGATLEQYFAQITTDPYARQRPTEAPRAATDEPQQEPSLPAGS